MNTVLALEGLYVVGWCVSAVLATRHWYRTFGVDGFGLEGAAWGLLVAFAWPVMSVAVLVAVVEKRVAA